MMCGYCGRPLQARLDGTFECAVCAPELAAIATPDEWDRWMRRTMAKNRARLEPAH